MAVAVVLDGIDRDDLQNFARWLKQQDAIAVRTVEAGVIGEIDADFILADLGQRPIATLDELPAAALARLVPVGVDRAAIAAIVKRHALPAIVEYGAWRDWAVRPQSRGTIVGKKSLLRHFHVFSDFFDPHYIVMDGGRRNLPALLGDYLVRLHE
ncbi:MAG: hypothetical protein ABI439_06945 [Rhodospirillales bacterium]